MVKQSKGNKIAFYLGCCKTVTSTNVSQEGDNGRYNWNSWCHGYT